MNNTILNAINISFIYSRETINATLLDKYLYILFKLQSTILEITSFNTIKNANLLNSSSFLNNLIKDPILTRKACFKTMNAINAHITLVNITYPSNEAVLVTKSFITNYINANILMGKDININASSNANILNFLHFYTQETFFWDISIPTYFL